jgi:Raf kinase inhibitor-like YbhB/YbcL family protein
MNSKRIMMVIAILVTVALATALAVAQAPAPAAGQGGPPAAGAPGGRGPGGPGGGGGGQGRQGGGGRGGPVFNVTSPAFPDGGEIPLKYSFYGQNVSPQFDFHWFNGMTPAEQPATVQTFAIIFRDMENATARGPVDTLHWSVFNIPATLKSLPEGMKAGEQPDGTRPGPGIRGGANGSYFGPGAGAGPFHHYMFEFFALDAKLDIPSTATRDQLLAAMEGHVVGKAVYGGRFRNVPAAP